MKTLCPFFLKIYLVEGVKEMVEELDVRQAQKAIDVWVTEPYYHAQYQMKRISKKDKPHFGCQLPFTPL